MPAYPSDRAEDIAASLVALPTGTPVTEVARRLLDLFTGGQVAPGTRLPPERQLAATLGVGRSAVREALAALEILGIVDVRPGSGTYLRGAASELLPQTLRWGLLISEHNTVELLELRSGLETYVARLAASRAENAAISRVQGHLDEMRAARDDYAAFAVADRKFHQALAESADNATLIDLLHVVRSLLHVYANRAVHDDDSVATAIEEHAAVLAAVARGDENGAAAAMADHMATATHRLKAEITR
ncbi:MAG: FadR family transcriptional regulator [Microbacterium sp.]|jgi:GntR family transcriptional repressor for pyruvate dehydrogenase complex|uniref:FadR family transcriptional regulator n=1 Tax=Microbacterium ginsengisoli TaxID=400772 RepID=A0A0F0LY09_9MICO|nr:MULTISPECIES: FCD domain-containing protein [Microbacterium]MAL05315.1 FadR family transcriptional regulator [Microbacterium sp.]MCK9917395.1 FCD domain-containing protein [Microbacteriaceae bacterium K1510]KJL44614.1 HTH-type transcriptional regulator LutR [Microbacterium ginsengisoli]KQR99273.1 GntR family transcriptional regulator [Microbacterium sp. Leaf347]KQS02578.1 GntR family transcriptional regulator [Microbacterium sp. Leaf351]